MKYHYYWPQSRILTDSSSLAVVMNNELTPMKPVLCPNSPLSGHLFHRERVESNPLYSRTTQAMEAPAQPWKNNCWSVIIHHTHFYKNTDYLYPDVGVERTQLDGTNLVFDEIDTRMESIQKGTQQETRNKKRKRYGRPDLDKFDRDAADAAAAAAAWPTRSAVCWSKTLIASMSPWWWTRKDNERQATGNQTRHIFVGGIFSTLQIPWIRLWQLYYNY